MKVDAQKDERPEHHGECGGNHTLETMHVGKVMVGVSDHETHHEVHQGCERTEKTASHKILLFARSDVRTKE
jgi:hypothetical protein